MLDLCPACHGEGYLDRQQLNPCFACPGPSFALIAQKQKDHATAVASAPHGPLASPHRSSSIDSCDDDVLSSPASARLSRAGKWPEPWLLSPPDTPLMGGGRRRRRRSARDADDHDGDVQQPFQRDVRGRNSTSSRDGEHQIVSTVVPGFAHALNVDHRQQQKQQQQHHHQQTAWEAAGMPSAAWAAARRVAVFTVGGDSDSDVSSVASGRSSPVITVTQHPIHTPQLSRPHHPLHTVERGLWKVDPDDGGDDEEDAGEGPSDDFAHVDTASERDSDVADDEASAPLTDNEFDDDDDDEDEDEDDEYSRRVDATPTRASVLSARIAAAAAYRGGGVAPKMPSAFVQMRVPRVVVTAELSEALMVTGAGLRGSVVGKGGCAQEEEEACHLVGARVITDSA
ncbi:hypothetical protein HK101_002777, partial [Irineochytrium annulatum]